jgi:hypothetical protein
MKLKMIFLMAVSAASVVTATAASADPWYGRDGDRWTGYRYGNSGYGDYGRRDDFRGYPEFKGVKFHIRQEIAQGLRDGWLDRWTAARLDQQIYRITAWESREFEAHGWGLPDDDRARIRSALDRIDHQVDEARDAM